MIEEQKQLIAQLEQERFTVNKRAQHLENELNDKKKVFYFYSFLFPYFLPLFIIFNVFPLIIIIIFHIYTG